MSDEEWLPSLTSFTRGCRARASLPVGRSSDQTRDRSIGVLYLQYGEETKQVWMSSEISCWDSVWALFAAAFPHQLTIKMLQSPSMAIYIRDTSRSVYYDLKDVRNIRPYSYLKAYPTDPAQAFNHHATTVTRGPVSAPRVHSLPSSPPTMVYCEGGTHGVKGVMEPGSATSPRLRRSSASCTSSSVIQERKDMKPDGGPRYSEWKVGASPLRTTSSRCSAPTVLTSDVLESGVSGIPRGLKQYRASIRPLMGYREYSELQAHSLHRQKSWKYEGSPLPVFRSPPLSPHRVGRVRMFDGQMPGCAGGASPERISPIRRCLRQDSIRRSLENTNRSRSSRSSSSTSPVFVDGPWGQPETQVQTLVAESVVQSERMNAMEEQIASLAGLVHHALSMEPDGPPLKEAVSHKPELPSYQPEGSSEVQNITALVDSVSPSTPLAPPAPLAPPSNSGLWQSLVFAKRKICELRLQLSQLKCLQLSNLYSVCSMLRMVGQELLMEVCDKLAEAEEATYQQRSNMEEERIHYLATEEKILTQLSELEDYVRCLQNSASSPDDQASVTLRDVEEGAVSLRQLGDALAILKDEFPVLKANMCSVLRTEVEAVRFLKEEPYKMDSMMKQVKALSETLSVHHRRLLQSTPSTRSAQEEPLKVLDQGPSESPVSSPKVQPRYSVGAHHQHSSPPTPAQDLDPPTVAEVSTETSNKNQIPGKTGQSAKGTGRSPPAPVASRNSTDVAACDQQSAPQLPITNGSVLKPVAAGQQDVFHDDGITGSCDTKKDVEEKVVKQGYSSSCPTAEEQEMTPPVASVARPHGPQVMNIEEMMAPSASKEEQLRFIYTSNQTNKERTLSPATVVQQKDQNEGTITIPEQTFEKVQAEKSNAVVALPLQKENKPKHWMIEPSPALQQNKSLSSSEETSVPDLEPLSLSLQSREQHNQEQMVQVVRNQGGSFSPKVGENEEPPPSPPSLTHQFVHRVSKDNMTATSGEEDPDHMKEFISESSAGIPSYTGHENYGFEDQSDSETVLVFLNVPVDLQSAYKPMSTLLANEEELGGSLCRDRILKREVTQREEEDQSANPHLGLGLTAISRNSHHSTLQDSESCNESQDQTNCFTKTQSKSKSKFKIPKNKLAALTQAFRTGKKKIGKRTPEAVKVDKEEKITSGKRQTKECKISEVNCTKEFHLSKSNSCDNDNSVNTRQYESHARVEALCTNTFRTISNLEESIKQLEMRMDNMTTPSSTPHVVLLPSQYHRSTLGSANRPQQKGKHKRERSSSQRPATQILHDPNPSQSKREQPHHQNLKYPNLPHSKREKPQPQNIKDPNPPHRKRAKPQPQILKDPNPPCSKRDELQPQILKDPNPPHRKRDELQPQILKHPKPPHRKRDELQPQILKDPNPPHRKRDELQPQILKDPKPPHTKRDELQPQILKEPKPHCSKRENPEDQDLKDLNPPHSKNENPQPQILKVPNSPHIKGKLQSQIVKDLNPPRSKRDKSQPQILKDPNQQASHNSRKVTTKEQVF